MYIYIYTYIYIYIYIYICIYIYIYIDVIYSKSITSDVSVPSAEKITLVDMYRKSRIFYYWLEKLSSAFKSYGCKVFSVYICIYIYIFCIYIVYIDMYI